MWWLQAEFFASYHLSLAFQEAQIALPKMPTVLQWYHVIIQTNLNKLSGGMHRKSDVPKM